MPGKITERAEEIEEPTGSEVFYFPFAFKSDGGGGNTAQVEESEYNGTPGLFVEGWAAVFDPRDRDGENWNLDLRPGSKTRRALELYFKNNPIVLYEHGRDPQVGRKAIGFTVDHKIDTYGVWVRDFLPRPEKSAGLLYDIYSKVKAGVYRTFSIAGRWAKDAKDTIVEVSDVLEHSVVSIPAMGLATFTLAKALDLKAGRGIDLEEALTLIEAGEKRGAMLSAANKAKIQQALDALEELLGLTDADDNPNKPTGGAATAATGGSEGGGAATGGHGMNGRMMSPARRGGLGLGLGPGRKAELSPDESTATATNEENYTNQQNQQTYNQDRGGQAALTQQPQPGSSSSSGSRNKQGVKSMTKASNAPELSGEGEGGANSEKGTVYQLTGEQFKAFEAMQAQFEKSQKEAEARALAEKQLSEEVAAEKAQKDAEEKRQAEIQSMATELAKSMRTGSRMSFAGGSDNSNLLYMGSKGVNFNRNSHKDGFSFTKFAKAGLKYQEANYMEDLKAADPSYKTMQESIGSSGGYIVPEQQSTEIEDLLRAQAVIRQLPGVRTITMNSDTLKMPRLTADATAAWGAEGSTLTASDLAVGEIRFVARKLYALVQVTKEMLADSNPAVDQLIRESIAAALALKEDDAFIQGSGIGETPLGITKYTNLNTVAFSAGAASAAPEFKALTKAAGVIRNYNARPTAMIMHSRVADQVLSAIDSSGQPIALNAIGGYRWAEVQAATGRNSTDPNAVQFGTMLGMTQATANQLTVTATTSGTSTVLMGDFRRFIIGERQGIEVEIDRSIGFLSDTVYIKATKRVDCVVTIPQAFCTITSFAAIDIA